MSSLQPGDFVVLLSVPAALIFGLSEEDKIAVKSVIGKTVRFAGISFGQAQLEFKDSRGDEHTIWVDVGHIRPA
jgi:hypothetical protein